MLKIGRQYLYRVKADKRGKSAAAGAKRAALLVSFPSRDTMFCLEVIAEGIKIQKGQQLVVGVQQDTPFYEGAIEGTSTRPDDWRENKFIARKDVGK